MDKYFKRSLLIFIATLIGLACFFALATSCRTVKPSEVSTEVKNDSTATSHTEKEKETVNQAVVDSLLLVIAKVRTAKPECDTVCQQYVDDLMQRMQMQKISGDNRYGVLYDQYTKALTMYANMAATSSTTKEVTDTKYIKQYYNINRTITVTAYKTHWFMKYSAWFGWLCAAVLIVLANLKARSWIKAKSSL